MQQLRLKKDLEPSIISRIHDTSTGASNYVTTFLISAVNATSTKLQVAATIVQKVSADLPLKHISEADTWTFTKELKLADPHFAIPSKINLILGQTLGTN